MIVDTNSNYKKSQMHTTRKSKLSNRSNMSTPKQPLYNGVSLVNSKSPAPLKTITLKASRQTFGMHVSPTPPESQGSNLNKVPGPHTPYISKDSKSSNLKSSLSGFEVGKSGNITSASTLQQDTKNKRR